MKKIMFLFILLSCFLFTVVPAFAEDSTTVGISPAATTVNPGQTFTVDIAVTPAVAIAGVQFNLNFDPNIVEALAVTEGNLLKQGGNSTYFQAGTITPGKITGVAGAITTTGGEVAGAGVFATVTFKAKNNGNTDLILDQVIAGNKAAQTVSVSITNGTVTVEAAAPPDQGKVTVALAGPSEVLKGNSFTLKVTVTEVTYLDACSYELVYNTSVLELEKVTGGEIDGNPIPIAHYKNEKWSGKVTVVQNIYGTEGVSGAGYLGKLHFKAVEASNKTGVKFQNGVLSDHKAQAIPANWVGITLQVKGTDGPGGPGGGHGDHNKDGRLDARDITLIELIVLGLNPLTDTADVNGDGVVDARDITATELKVLNA